MRPRFHDLHRLPPTSSLRPSTLVFGRWTLDPGLWTFLPDPFRKLKRQQLPEQRAHAHTRVVITSPSKVVLFFFIISINRTIESQFHEGRKGDRPCPFNFPRYFFGDFVQFFGGFGVWCGFSYYGRRSYRLLWQR